MLHDWRAMMTLERPVLAYHDADFPASDEARPLRIMAEYLQPLRVVFPGGFGTFDELFEMLTLAQTRKLDGNMLILLYGSSYWKEVINFDALVRHEVITPEDLELFSFVDEPDEALKRLKQGIVLEPAAKAPPRPAFARSRHPNDSEAE
jgi:hypothetical protein